MKIERIRIKRFKILKDVEIKELPNMCVFLGANGSGKSTLFDVFGFLSDSLKSNVKAAIEKRGGFQEVISRDQKGDIEFELMFGDDKEKEEKRALITYTLKIGLKNKMPIVRSEMLCCRIGQNGDEWKLLELKEGEGFAVINEDQYGCEGAKEKIEKQVLDSPDILGLKGLGQFKKFKTIANFRKILENWYISNFDIQMAKGIVDVGIAEHLSATGDNLPLAARFMYQNHRQEFDKILEKMKQRIPGISAIEAKETEDGRIVLRFQDGNFKDPFISKYVSDGTIKMFGYLLLLHSPHQYPLLCIEEPENYLYPELLYELAEEFREYAERGGQVFISTHSTDFVNGLKIEELFWLTRENGYSVIRSAVENQEVKLLYEEGDQLGSLWKQKYLQGSSPF